MNCCKNTSIAAEKGHLECLKYTHENGCEWDPETTQVAAIYGHLECLFYCLENDCPIHPNILDILYEDQKDKNLLINIKLRKVLLHSRLKNDITVDKYLEFVKTIEEYEEYRNKFYTFLESERNVPTDVIKYEVMKYI